MISRPCRGPLRALALAVLVCSAPACSSEAPQSPSPGSQTGLGSDGLHPASTNALEGSRAVACDVGAVVDYVEPDSAAQRVGLEADDLVVAFNHQPVLDRFEYERLADAYADSWWTTLGFNADLTVCRGGNAITVRLGSGRTALALRDTNPVLDHICDLVRAENTADAEQAVSRAQADGRLSEAQSLVAEVLLLPDDAPPEVAARREELLGRLLAVSADPALPAAAAGRFYASDCYTAAVAMYRRMLELDADDVDARLNLAAALVRLGRVDDAERQVDLVYGASGERLSPRGRLVAERIRAGIACGRDDAAWARELCRAEFESSPDGETMLMYLLTAAKMRDARAFAAAEQECQAMAPNEMRAAAPLVDAVRMYAMVGVGRSRDALAVASKWRADPEPARQLAATLRRIPTGVLVLAVWDDLVVRDQSAAL